jgi:hypothetical protein
MGVSLGLLARAEGCTIGLTPHPGGGAHFGGGPQAAIWTALHASPAP